MYRHKNRMFNKFSSCCGANILAIKFLQSVDLCIWRHYREFLIDKAINVPIFWWHINLFLSVNAQYVSLKSQWDFLTA